MKRITRKVITIETRKITVVRKGARRPARWCEKCSSVTEVFSPGETAGFRASTVDEVYRRVAQGKLHFVNEESGELVCGRALERELQDASESGIDPDGDEE